MMKKQKTRCNSCGTKRNVFQVHDEAHGYIGYLCQNCIDRHLAEFRQKVAQAIKGKEH
jgi:hypothetical protein